MKARIFSLSLLLLCSLTLFGQSVDATLTRLMAESDDAAAAARVCLADRSLQSALVIDTT